MLCERSKAMYNLSSKTQRTAKDNLMDQANVLVKNARIKGIKTRVRYLECFDHFAQYYADEWHGQKIANISAKHIYGYAEYMKEIKHYCLLYLLLCFIKLNLKKNTPK